MAKWYFKHGNDATYGNSIQGMLDRRDYRAIALFWFILERLSAAEDSESIEINLSHIAHTFRTYPRGIRNSLRTLSETIDGMSFECVGNVLRISAPNFLKFQESRNQKPIYKNRKDKNRKEEKRNIKEKTHVVQNSLFDADENQRAKRAPSTAPKIQKKLDHALVEIWNSNCGALQKCKALSTKRLAACKSRWNENPNAQYWNETAKRISESKFCNGHNDREWTANFDFFIRPDTHIRANEGLYDGGGKFVDDNRTIDERLADARAKYYAEHPDEEI